MTAMDSLLPPGTGRQCIVLAGDLSLGDAYLNDRWSDARRRLELEPFSFFEQVEPLISDKSLFIANLETVLAVAPEDRFGGRKKFLGWDQPDRTIGILKRIGIDAVSLANNHAVDFGPDLLIETIRQLNRAGIGVFGAGANEAEAARPLSVALPTGKVNILAGFEYRRNYDLNFGFYATSTRAGVNPLSSPSEPFLANAIRRVRDLEPQSLIIAFPHWGGAKNYGWMTAEMGQMNAEFLAKGADMVIGHGAHRMQEVLSTPSGTTAFSIGNFVFNSPGRYRSHGAPPYSLVARLEVAREEHGLSGCLRLYPILSDNRTTGFRPRPVSSSEARELHAQLRGRAASAGEFDATFALDRDERGWHLASVGAISRRIGPLLQ